MKKAPWSRENTGTIRVPTTLFSVRAGPGNWVCFWYQTIPMCATTSAAMIAGNSSTWVTYRRGMMMSPGKSPPKTSQCSQVPATGMDIVIPEKAARRPVPDSRSSGSEYPKNPSNSARINSSEPITQVISRGRRNAPVKNIRHICTIIDATNSNAVQWCTCRTNNPPRTSKLRFRVDS